MGAMGEGGAQQLAAAQRAVQIDQTQRPVKAALIQMPGGAVLRQGRVNVAAIKLAPEGQVALRMRMGHLPGGQHPAGAIGIAEPVMAQGNAGVDHTDQHGVIVHRGQVGGGGGSNCPARRNRRYAPQEAGGGRRRPLPPPSSP